LKNFILIFLLLQSTLFAQIRLVINTGWYPPNKNLIENILDELFYRVKIDYSLQRLTAERALKNANLGLDDGDAVRVFEVGDMFKNLRRVDGHFFSANFSAFYVGKPPSIKAVEDFKDKRVTIVNGTKIVQKFVKDNHFTKVDKAIGFQSALLKLINKEVDIAILNQHSALSVIKTLHLEKVVMEHKPPLIKKKMYLYLHKKHENLIPALESELKKMKEDGSYDRIVQAHIEQHPSEKEIIHAP